MLATQLRRASGAGQEVKNDLRFEVGRKRPTWTRHGQISLRWPVNHRSLVQRKGRTTEVYLKDYASGAECHAGLAAYLKFYCEERPNQALSYRTPLEVYRGGPAAKGMKEEGVGRGSHRAHGHGLGSAPRPVAALQAATLRPARARGEGITARN